MSTVVGRMGFTSHSMGLAPGRGDGGDDVFEVPEGAVFHVDFADGVGGDGETEYTILELFPDAVLGTPGVIGNGWYIPGSPHMPFPAEILALFVFPFTVVAKGWMPSTFAQAMDEAAPDAVFSVSPSSALAVDDIEVFDVPDELRAESDVPDGIAAAVAAAFSNTRVAICANGAFYGEDVSQILTLGEIATAQLRNGYFWLASFTIYPTALSEAELEALTAVPLNSVLPEISGIFEVGETLSITNGTWSPAPDQYSYQWSFFDNNLQQLVFGYEQTFEIPPEAEGTGISCEVGAHNSVGWNYVNVVGETVQP